MTFIDRKSLKSHLLREYLNRKEEIAAVEAEMQRTVCAPSGSGNILCMTKGCEKKYVQRPAWYRHIRDKHPELEFKLDESIKDRRKSVPSKVKETWVKKPGDGFVEVLLGLLLDLSYKMYGDGIAFRATVQILILL